MKTIVTFLSVLMFALTLQALPPLAQHAAEAVGVTNVQGVIDIAKQVGTNVSGVNLAGMKESVRGSVSNAINSDTVKVAKTNLNSVMIDILTGVRDAGKEVYGVTKDAIRTSVNFVEEQAPQVMKEFLMWHMARAILYALAFLGVALALWLTGRFIHNKVLPDSRDKGGTWFSIVVLRIIALGLVLFGVGSNALTVTKIAIAPKVYVIEYVVDTIQGDHRTPDTR